MSVCECVCVSVCELYPDTRLLDTMEGLLI